MKEQLYIDLAEATGEKWKVKEATVSSVHAQFHLFGGRIYESIQKSLWLFFKGPLH